MTLVVANWKMNLGPKEAQDWFDVVVPALRRVRVQVLVLPSHPLLPLALRRRGHGLMVGGQNCGVALQGPYTGEVSPRLLKELGCTHVLLGHSERRLFFAESPELVARRLEAALAAELSPIVCVGEAVGEERTAVLRRQLKPLLSCAGSFAVAYEPLAAIGTGKAATAASARAAAAQIQDFLGQPVPVLYGGSVTPANAASFLREAGMDGLLVGTASLDGATFVALLEATDATP